MARSESVRMRVCVFTKELSGKLLFPEQCDYSTLIVELAADGRTNERTAQNGMWKVVVIAYFFLH